MKTVPIHVCSYLWYLCDLPEGSSNEAGTRHATDTKHAADNQTRDPARGGRRQRYGGRTRDRKQIRSNYESQHEANKTPNTRQTRGKQEADNKQEQFRTSISVEVDVSSNVAKHTVAVQLVWKVDMIAADCTLPVAKTTLGKSHSCSLLPIPGCRL